MHNPNPFMTEYRKREAQETRFYQDPLDQWLEDHPIIAALIGAALVYALLFLAMLI